MATRGAAGEGARRKGSGGREGGKEQLIDLARVHFPSLNSKRNKLGQLEGKSEERASGDMGRKKEREGRGQGGKEEEEEMFAPRHISCVIALCNETRVFVLAYKPPPIALTARTYHTDRATINI